MSINVNDKNLGHATAYAYYKAGGGTMTEAEFTEFMADFGTASQTAVEAAQAALASKNAAQTAATTATNKATEATTAATTATTKAGEASTSASTATSAKDTAVSASQTATTKATEATTAAASVQSSAAQIQTNADDISELKEELSDAQDWLGYPKNLFDARDLTVSNTNNWSIDSATKTSVTITHKTTYSTGYPYVVLDLPSGDYVFHADYTNSATAFSLQTDGSWVKALTDGAEFTIDSAKENAIYFANDTVGTYKITEISVVAKEKSSGKIPSLEDATSINTAKIADLTAKIADIKEGFNNIATPSIEPMDGTETQARAIRANGEIYTAGSNNYRIAKFAVSPSKTYWITATSNWGNALWCYYDSNDSVVEVGTVSASGSDDTTIIDGETTAPVGSAFLVIAYNSTIKNGAVKTQTGYTLGAEWRGKKWVCVGDSLTAENIRTTKHYFDYVADETGITTVNMGDSGSGYAREQDVGTAFYQRISDCPTDADVVTIFGSFNDLGAGLSIGSVDDTGTTTLAGCINTTIDNLQTVIPLVNLGIVAPTPWDTTQPSTSGNAYNYVEMLKAICARRSIPFLDLWRESNLRPWDADFRELAYSKDGGSGTHPDENGHKLIAPRFKAFLETLLM